VLAARDQKQPSKDIELRLSRVQKQNRK
jgi:hypothetical protein